MEVGTKTLRAPEIYGDFWFNTEPLALSALHGQVILINFWDCTRTSSIRMLPYIQEWHRRYKDSGLIVIGVHTPEFSFADNLEVVEKAIKRLGIVYPIVTDNKYLVWGAFANRTWPSTYLIDRDGYIRYGHSGEGNYTSIEHTIQALLVDAGYRGELPMLMDAVRDSDRQGVVCYRTTPDIYVGYVHGMIGNIEGFNLDSTIDYRDPGVYLDGRFYAHGRWFVNRDHLRYEGDPDGEGYLLVPYHALEVNAVMRPEAESSLGVTVFQDDHPLAWEIRGEDISVDEGGRSYVNVEEGRVYNLVKNLEFGEHKLKLATSSKGLLVYSFAFVTGVIPEVVPSDRI